MIKNLFTMREAREKLTRIKTRRPLRKVLKHVFVLFVFGAMPLLQWGCSNEESHLDTWMQENGKLKVLSTTSMIDDIVKEIGKERIDHLTLIIGELDPHSYELVKGDDEKLSFANIVFFNGLGLEHGASLRYRLEHLKNGIAIGNAIQKTVPEKILKLDGQIDPHIWMDVSLWMKGVPAIVEALSNADPAGKNYYETNGQELLKRMKKAHIAIYDQLQKVPSEKRYLVTSHDAFQYFTRGYLAEPNEVANNNWQMRCAAPEGLAPEGQLSSTDIQGIIDHLCKYNIEVVFAESNVSQDSLKKIINACKQKGLNVHLAKEVLYGDAMGSSGSDADSYLKMMHYDAEVLVHEWQ